MKQSEKIERRNRMTRMKQEGLTYDAIGDEFGLSKQAVYQIINNHNYNSRKWEYGFDDRIRDMEAHGSTREKIADHFGTSLVVVNLILSMSRKEDE